MKVVTEELQAFLIWLISLWKTVDFHPYTVLTHIEAADPEECPTPKHLTNQIEFSNYNWKIKWDSLDYTVVSPIL